MAGLFSSVCMSVCVLFLCVLLLCVCVLTIRRSRVLDPRLMDHTGAQGGGGAVFFFLKRYIEINLVYEIYPPSFRLYPPLFFSGTLACRFFQNFLYESLRPLVDTYVFFLLMKLLYLCSLL